MAKTEKSPKGTKTKKIKDKLLLFIVPAVVVTIIILVAISSFLSKSRLEEMARNELESSITNQADNIYAWLQQNLENFSTIKASLEGMDLDETYYEEVLTTFVGSNSNAPNGVYIATQSGKVYTGRGTDLSITNPTDQQWYKEGLSRINMAYGEPYKNDEGEYVISASGILNDGSDEIKVVAADVTLGKISIIVNSGVKMKNANSFLVDRNDMMVLAHRDSSLVSTTLTGSLGRPVMDGTYNAIISSDYSTTNLGQYTVAFKEIKGTDWLLVSYIENSVILANVTQLITILLIIGVVATILIVILVSAIIGRVIKPLSYITENIHAMSSGDFTIEVKNTSNDEIGVMGQQVGKFVGLMRDMLSSINDESEKLKEESDNSDQVSRVMFDASQSQESAMVNLNQTVDQLAIAVNEIAENATTLAMVVSDTKANSDTASERMAETVEISKSGRADMEKLSVAMGEIQAANQELVASVEKVGQASEEITNIVGMISEIAEETNLLSLNASIEAARAGEAGKGFAVVASEIGGLAKHSAESAQSISDLINQVRDQIEKVVSQADASAKSIEANGELIDAAVTTFDKIFENIESTSDVIKEMIADINKVDEVSTNVAAISEEQAASVDEILETSKNMVEQVQAITQSSQDVADNSHQLANTSQTLTGYVQQFKIVKEDTDYDE